MRTGMSQHTQMRQEIKINPRLYQAMDMLYTSRRIDGERAFEIGLADPATVPGLTQV